MVNKCFTRMGQISIAVKDIDRADEICKKYGMEPMRSFQINKNICFVDVNALMVALSLIFSGQTCDSV